VVIGRDSLVRLTIFVVVVALLILYVREHHTGFLRRYLGGEGDWGRTEQVVVPEVPAVEPPPPPPADPPPDFFVEFRLERERVRSQQVEQLRELIENAKIDEATRNLATARWLTLTERMGREVDAENLVRARGFADALVVLKDDGATVIVRAPELTPLDAARIADIVIRTAGVRPESISIQAKP
jgi:stage III sporulation protein AH